jgi:hypothetical protein
MCLSRRSKLVAGAGKLPLPTLEEAQRNFGEANEPLPPLGLPSLASIALLARSAKLLPPRPPPWRRERPPVGETQLYAQRLRQHERQRDGKGSLLGVNP